MMNTQQAAHSLMPRKLNIYWHMEEKFDEQGAYFEAQLEESDTRLVARSMEDLKQQIDNFEMDYWTSFRNLKAYLGIH